MNIQQFITLSVIVLSATCAFGQKKTGTASFTTDKTAHSVAYKHSFGASLFMLSNFSKEPAYALKYWPVDTNFPVDFASVEEGAPKYIFEPSLNFGIKF